jgi:hypothetical protein
MESIMGYIVVGLVEALIFGVIWKKKVTPLREEAKKAPTLRDLVCTLVKVNKATAARTAAGLVKKALKNKPEAKAVLDDLIGLAKAYIAPEKP